MMLRRKNKPAQKDQTRVHPVMDPLPDSGLAASDEAPRKPRGTSFFRLPGLFVGFGTKGAGAGLSDAAAAAADSARSPTSPLEYRVLSGLRKNSFVLSPRSPGGGPDTPRKSWDCARVGLGLVDSLSDGSTSPGNVLAFSDSRSIVFGSTMRINISSPRISSADRAVRDGDSRPSPTSLVLYSSGPVDSGSPVPSGKQPAACVEERQLLLHGSGSSTRMAPRELGKVHSWSVETRGSSSSSSPSSRNWSIRTRPRSNSEVFPVESKPMDLGGGSPLLIQDVDLQKLYIVSPTRSASFGIVGPLSPRDIELSEDYTRITTHGPNPKTTHIFGDCILEGHPSELPVFADRQGGEEVETASPWIVDCQGEDPLPPPLLMVPADDFLSSCFFCKKKLEGKDIYMYRGEKAFCSCDCREKEISMEEEKEKERALIKQSNDDENYPNGGTISIASRSG